MQELAGLISQTLPAATGGTGLPGQKAPPQVRWMDRMVTTVTAYALVALFIALEGVLRKGCAAKSLVVSSSDRGSTRWVGWAFLQTSMVSSPWWNRRTGPRR